MNVTHYEMIYDEFADGHEYLHKDVVDWRPKGDLGIRVTLRDGTMYDYNSVNKCVRKVKDQRTLTKDDYTDEFCRSSFAEHLIEMLEIRGFTQQTLAECTGISKGSINAYINKTKTPSITNMRKIAHALDCSIAELMD